MSDELGESKETLTRLKGKAVARYMDLKNYIDYTPIWSPEAVFERAEAYMNAKLALAEAEEKCSQLDLYGQEVPVPLDLSIGKPMSQRHALELVRVG